MTVVSGNIGFMRMFLGDEASTQRTVAGFRAFGRYVFGTLTNKTNISIWYYLVPDRLSTNSKTRDLEWRFCVRPKICF